MKQGRFFSGFVLLAAVALIGLSVAQVDIVTAVRTAIAQGNFKQGDALLQQYRAKQGITPEWLEALSWMGRGELAAKQYDQAGQYAKQTHELSLAELKKRQLDAEEHLPIALGAAVEVEAQSAAARGDRAQAVEFLRQQLALYQATSIATRIQKNLNLLTLEGKPAPALEVGKYLGSKPQALGALRGKPVLLYFWAHWCGDCRAEAPLLAQLKAEYASRGLTLMGPTQLYGYAARGEDATPQKELAYIEEVRKQYYAGLSDVPVPVSARNFKMYGASTTPTLVLIDRKGVVRLYHPGRMTYDELKASVEKALAG